MHDETKPWDARLVEWMARGSNEARGGGRRAWTPKERAAYAVFWVGFLTVETISDGHWEWWLLAAFIAVAVTLQLLLWLRDRRTRRHSPSPEG
jgi:hypothetical protein